MPRRERNPVDISLYAIADPERAKNRPIDILAEDAMAGGASLLQYRDKSASARVQCDNAAAISEALYGSDVPLIINDRSDIAFVAAADGVHLGQDDPHPSRIRELLGNKAIIGYSVKTADEARNAPLEDLDYVFIGGVFETESKDNPAAIGVSGWRDLAAMVRQRDSDMPIGAIAGINETNIAQLIEAGADGVAIISAIFMADNVQKATRRLRAIVDDAMALRKNKKTS